MLEDNLLAAVDLGSNSFRLEVARIHDSRLTRVDYLKETVRLGNGLDGERKLSAAAMRRGLDCLARFAERIKGMPASAVRAVATQTLREARNRDDFLRAAEQVLGYPIAVISGMEEARLIYLGVAHLLPQSDERRLVIDIGGRSTEIISGQGFDAEVMESYRVGSVAWSMKYFPRGEFSAEAFAAAEIAAKAVMEEALESHPRRSWDVAYGSSGTIGAVGDIWLWPRARKAWSAPLISIGSRASCCARATPTRCTCRASRTTGAPCSAAAWPCSAPCFPLLQIEQMQVAQGALRHGLLFDLLGRAHVESDVRGGTVSRLCALMHVDMAQARRVARAAGVLFASLAEGERLQSPDAHAAAARSLDWAAQLHEIGCLISHSDHHKHGAYVLEHADGAGFTQPEFHRLGQLVLGQRGKLKKLDIDFEDGLFVAQLQSLRLAVILCHARRDALMKGVSIEAAALGTKRLNLCLSNAWAEQHPQSLHLLAEEAQAWQKTGWQFELRVG